jgi:putative endonuclease
MTAYCYILHSIRLNRFYIGSTLVGVKERLEKHMNHHYGDNKFTSKTDDWELFLSFECEDLRQARLIEKHIKRMKSKKYLKNLQKYPEMIDKLKLRYLCS